MTSIMQIIRKNSIISVTQGVYFVRCFCHGSSDEDNQFRVFDVRYRTKKDVVESVKYIKAPSPPPREKEMPTNQDWSDVWPGPRSFHPASVPLPVKQGFDRRGKLSPPGKYANAELMKLPNFLHLTPLAVKKHCEILQQFCTPWPERLSYNEEIDEHFPLQITSTEYCHSSPKIRDPKARIVTFQFKLSHLSLDKHSNDKIQRLLGLRYDDANDIVTLTTDRCPLRKQNYDYNQFLLLALFYESWKVESWEKEKVEEDMEYYDWEKNASKKSYIALKAWSHKHNKLAVSESSLLASEDLPNYREAVFELMNKGETSQRLLNYKRAVLKIMFQQERYVK